MNKKLFFDTETTHVVFKTWHRYVPVFYPSRDGLKLGTLIAPDDGRAFKFVATCPLGNLMNAHYTQEKDVLKAKKQIEEAFNKAIFG